MEILIPNIFYLTATPLLCCCFFCRFCRIPCKGLWCAGYVALSAVLLLTEESLLLPKSAGLLLEIAFLCIYGGTALKGRFTLSLSVATLITSVSGICSGMIQAVTYWILSNINPQDIFILKYADMGKSLAAWLLTGTVLFLILHIFRSFDPGKHRFPLLFPVIPIFFIALTERIIRNLIYGDTLIWDNRLGLIYPVVPHGEILLMQVFAFLCLFALLGVYKKNMSDVDAAQTIQSLKQQAHAQEIYINEAQLRYEATAAFRHDIKNHLTVLAELLKTGRQEDACGYLSRLNLASASLSLPIQTGNTALNALLGSKCSIAVQHSIRVFCEIKIPSCSHVEDMDWCILLANALDNAINASLAIDKNDRTLDICGKQKGNFYFIEVKNRCSDTVKTIPPDGTGISNMRAVAKKYGGTVHTELTDKIYELQILLLISQPETNIPHTTD